MPRQLKAMTESAPSIATKKPSLASSLLPFIPSFIGLLTVFSLYTALVFNQAAPATAPIASQSQSFKVAKKLSAE